MLQYPEDRWESCFARVNGVQLHYKRAGSGPPVLLLHGYPETWYTWRHLIGCLEDRFTVYAPDFRGWGDSQAKGPYGLNTLIDDTVALMESLGHETYSVVGHDWGGAAAYAIARQAPERIDRLVTIGMPVRRFNPLRPLHFYFFNLPLIPDALMRVRSDAVVAFILRWWAYRTDAFGPEELAVYQAAARRPGANEASLAYYRNTLRSALRRRKKNSVRMVALPKIPEVPWRVIWGANDPVSPLENLTKLQEDLGALDAVVIDNAGHFPQEEQPAAFTQAIQSFLAETEQ